jgi:hypothetical protein
MLFVPEFSSGYPTLDESKPFPFLCIVHGKITVKSARSDSYSTSVGLFILVALCSRLSEYVHQTNRLHGYLSFYRETQLLRRLPLLAISFGKWLCSVFNF